jgi:hypothetical protein
MAIRSRTAPAVFMLISLLAAGCGSSANRSAPTRSPVAASAVALPSAASSASTSAAPSVAAPSVAALTKDVARAKLKSVSARVNLADSSGTPPLDVCGGKIAAYAQVTATTTWVWIGIGTPIFKQGVFAFQTILGSTVVAQAKALATGCASTTIKTGGITTRIAAGGSMSLHAPAGVDGFYAFCETHKIIKPAMFGGTAGNYCTAVLSRGHLVVFLNAGGSQVSAATTAIARYLAPAAKALVGAVGSA